MFLHPREMFLHPREMFLHARETFLHAPRHNRSPWRDDRSSCLSRIAGVFQWDL